ncbi:reverse transcriptase domain-containing protein [Tanacetum coccineum]|uniref:Reverse transcriptase domain-containing protein n=1 Tax=Tanacetum coccineum TaxID=301880 RepID=A0ABQ5FVC8_9ASTR
MEVLLRAHSQEGYGEAIVLPEINADHFEIKTNLLQLVQANSFNGRENENPHAHINSFKRITLTLRFRCALLALPLRFKDGVRESCVTCGGAHAWYNCPATDNNQASVCATTGTYNQVNPPNRLSNQMAPPGFALVQNNGQNRSLLLMPRFAPTIKVLLMNKEKLLELAKIPLIEYCSEMLLKKASRKLRDPDKLSYSIPWVSPVHCVPKKGGITIVANEENELISTRLVTGWRVCIDYRKLNEATRKDHFPLPFMDQMIERLAGNEFYCFLDGFSGYFQIPIDPQDQKKTTFTCPYGTFAYRRMPFGLCNASGTFQRCMMAIFHDMIEKTMEVFMDDFSVFGDSFDSCLSNLEKMLKRCEDTNLVLNWEKCHFMCREGIVLGHKI